MMKIPNLIILAGIFSLSTNTFAASCADDVGNPVPSSVRVIDVNSQEYQQDVLPVMRDMMKFADKIPNGSDLALAKAIAQGFCPFGTEERRTFKSWSEFSKDFSSSSDKFKLFQKVVIDFLNELKELNPFRLREKIMDADAKDEKFFESVEDQLGQLNGHFILENFNGPDFSYNRTAIARWLLDDATIQLVDGQGTLPFDPNFEEKFNQLMKL